MANNRDYWIKQSEMLQSIVIRMANNSLEVKKVGLTVWAAIVGFGFTNHSKSLFLLAFIAFMLFGIMDIYYLYLERRFRSNFDRLARILSGKYPNADNDWINLSQENFLKLDSSTSFLQQLPKTLQSWANLPYLITLVITIALHYAPLPPAK